LVAATASEGFMILLGACRCKEIKKFAKGFTAYSVSRELTGLEPKPIVIRVYASTPTAN